MKVLTVDPDKCTGCRLCELACSLKHTGQFNPARARLKVVGFDEIFSVPVTCFQCEKPYCAEACPTGAITREASSGVVSVSEEKCVGCKMCIQACPFGAIVFSSEDGVPFKCELCGGEPECVLFCPTGALEFRTAETATIRKRIALSEDFKRIHEQSSQAPSTR
ncbi:4Fe-4S dicluster domain-containing protein [Chloroflexota bacterium]